MNLLDYLAKKEEEYREFDPLRAPYIFSKLAKDSKNLSNPKCKIIQILGTNGKGSTGRFLALMLRAFGFSVGHFTSPHLLSVCERFWLNGENLKLNVLDEALNKFDFEVLEEASYFEILTFLSLEVFSSCDYFICEAGLGGEYDSTTTCFKSYMKVFTKIDFDHQDRLGNSIREIATTKLNAINVESKCVFVGIQEHNEVYNIATNIATLKNVKLKTIKTIPQYIKDYCKLNNYPPYQYENLTLASAVLCELGIDKESLYKIPKLDLLGRMQKLRDNVYLDVAHNVSGAKEILEVFRNSKIILVYNSYFDKNPFEILKILRPIIERVEIFEVKDNQRIISKDSLCEILDSLHIKYCDFESINGNHTYLVCGSFSVVGEFLSMGF